MGEKTTQTCSLTRWMPQNKASMLKPLIPHEATLKHHKSHSNTHQSFKSLFYFSLWVTWWIFSKPFQQDQNHHPDSWSQFHNFNDASKSLNPMLFHPSTLLITYICEFMVIQKTKKRKKTTTAQNTGVQTGHLQLEMMPIRDSKMRY